MALRPKHLILLFFAGLRTCDGSDQLHVLSANGGRQEKLQILFACNVNDGVRTA